MTLPRVGDLVDGVRRGDRAAIGRAITLVESLQPAHEAPAQELLARLMPLAIRSQRVGISGVPGVGKSTFIEALGTRRTRAGQRVAVLAVDPSSTRTQGSILGDKTRMRALATDPRAFIRPSPTSGALGGVARRTREAIVVVEAAGYEVVLVETVGVGQSEFEVASMVDFFLVLMLAGAGDELQGIKRGILELVDALAIAKADGDNLAAARRARGHYEHALHAMAARSDRWSPPVLTCSAQTGDGIDAIWAAIEAHRALLGDQGIARLRADQATRWLWSLVHEGLRRRVEARGGAEAAVAEIEARVAAGHTSVARGAAEILQCMGLG